MYFLSRGSLVIEIDEVIHLLDTLNMESGKMVNAHYTDSLKPLLPFTASRSSALASSSNLL